LADAAREGDQTQSKRMLTAQMSTLDILFNTLVERAGANNQEGYLGACESYLRLAFKAQAQSRSAAEALNEIINPRTTAFVKNVGHNQQVNIGPRAEKSENPPNELLEVCDGEQLEFGATSAAISDGEAVATVGTLDGATDTAGKARGES
jgi:hypothetical protein